MKCPIIQASLRVKVQAYLIELFSILTDITSRYRSHFGRSLFSIERIGTSKMRVISECDIILDWNLLNQIGLNHNSERRLYIESIGINFEIRILNIEGNDVE